MSNFYIIYILKKLEYKFNITLELENIKFISNYYNYNLLRIKLNKYNFFELLYFVNKLELLLYINLSKKAIINKFVITKLDINIDFSNYSFGIQGNNIKWTIQKILRQTFNIVILNNINIFEICTGDIIKIKEKKYIIFLRLYQFLSKKKISFDDEKYDTLYVILEKLNYDNENRYVYGHTHGYGQELISSYGYGYGYGYGQELISGQELIDKFENEDITYIKSNYLNYYNDNLSEYID